MSSVNSKIGKRFTIYLPKQIVDKIGINEGDKISLSVEGNKIIIEHLKDPIELALKGKKFIKLSPEEIEKISLEEQRKYENFA